MIIETTALAAIEAELAREAAVEMLRKLAEAEIAQFHPFRTLVMNEQFERLAMRPLTDNEKISVMEATGMKAETLKDAMIDQNEVVHLRSTNERLVGEVHDKTNVKYVSKEVYNKNGVKIEVVVPEFDSVFDTYLSEKNILGTPEAHIEECMKNLKNEIIKNSELRGKFTSQELEMIDKGKTPRGYTWHHDAPRGKMQLVKTSVHASSGHTGGMSIWGTGY